MKPEYKLVAKASYIRTVEALAAEIWPEAFRRWLNGKQAGQLVNALQSADRVEADIDNNVNYFLILLAGKPVGYFAFHTTHSALILDHLYLQPAARRRHIGKDVVSYCQRLGRGDEKTRLACRVHQKDLNTAAFCKAMGLHPLPADPLTCGALSIPCSEWECHL